MRVLSFFYNIPSQLFGCRHDHLSRPFTIDAESYMVCLDCGKQVFYSTETMRRLSSRELRRRHASQVVTHATVKTRVRQSSDRAAAEKDRSVAA